MSVIGWALNLAAVGEHFTLKTKKLIFACEAVILTSGELEARILLTLSIWGEFRHLGYRHVADFNFGFLLKKEMR